MIRNDSWLVYLAGGGGKLEPWVEKDWVLNPVSWPVWGALTAGGGRGLTTVGGGGDGGGVLVPGLRAMAGAATRE